MGDEGILITIGNTWIQKKIFNCVTLVIILPPWELKLANKVHAEAIRKVIVDLSMEIMNVCTGTLS